MIQRGGCIFRNNGPRGNNLSAHCGAGGRIDFKDGEITTCVFPGCTTGACPISLYTLNQVSLREALTQFDEDDKKEIGPSGKPITAFS